MATVASQFFRENLFKLIVPPLYRPGQKSTLFVRGVGLIRFGRERGANKKRDGGVALFDLPHGRVSFALTQPSPSIGPRPPLANDGLDVVAGDVVPREAVAVEAVQHGQARLVPVLEQSLPVAFEEHLNLAAFSHEKPRPALSKVY